MLNVLLLLADAEPAKTNPTPGADMFFYIIAPLALFLMFVVLPMRKESKQRRELMSSLKKGDRVVVNGFLVGAVDKVVKAEKPEVEDELLLRIDENANVRLRVLRSSVTRILRTEDAPKEAKDGSA